MVSRYDLTTVFPQWTTVGGREWWLHGQIFVGAKGQEWKKNTEHLLLPLESEPVQNEDLGRQKDASHLTVVKGDSQEVQGASPVHRRTGDVEGKARDGGIHQDTEVVSEVGSGDAKGIHAGQNEDRAGCKQSGAQERLVHRGVVGLISQGQLVKMVTEDAQREDGKGEKVASVVGATEYTSQVVVPIFYSMKRPKWHEHLLRTSMACVCCCRRCRRCRSFQCLDTEREWRTNRHEQQC